MLCLCEGRCLPAGCQDTSLIEGPLENSCYLSLNPLFRLVLPFLLLLAPSFSYNASGHIKLPHPNYLLLTFFQLVIIFQFLLSLVIAAKYKDVHMFSFFLSFAGSKFLMSAFHLSFWHDFTPPICFSFSFRRAISQWLCPAFI